MIFLFFGVFALGLAGAQPSSPSSLGTLSFPTSCSSAAQPHIERGVALLHSFQYEEAAQEFDAGASRDSSCASDVLQVQQGSLYPALHRLEKRRWLRADWAATETGREARFYTLTPLGRKQLGDQRANWERLSVAISGILSTAE